jgi:hypothetical protein
MPIAEKYWVDIIQVGRKGASPFCDVGDKWLRELVQPLSAQQKVTARVSVQ